MIRWSDIWAQQEHVNDLLREVERDQFARQLLPKRARRERLYDRVLAALGRALVAWGCRLQERAATAWRLTQQPPLQTDPPCPCPGEN